MCELVIQLRYSPCRAPHSRRALPDREAGKLVRMWRYVDEEGAPAGAATLRQQLNAYPELRRFNPPRRVV